MKKEIIIKSFNKLLATTFILSQKVHNIHWNVKGQNFAVIHKMTDILYVGLNGFIDDIAEKIIQQGGVPLVTLADYIDNSIIKEVEKNSFSIEEAIKITLKDLEDYSVLCESINNNCFTQPLMDEILIFVDKQKWFFAASNN